MANQMMQEHMPIDKNSMAQMARILMANPDMGVNTAIQMKKLDIPITNEMNAQFENYMDDTNAVHKALDSFISELPATLAGKEMPLEQLKVFDSQLLQILADGMENGIEKGMEAMPEMADVDSETQMFGKGDTTVVSAQGQTGENITTGQTNEPVITEQNAANTESIQTNVSVDGKHVTTQKEVLKLIQNLFGDTGITSEDTPTAVLNKLSHFILN